MMATNGVRLYGRVILQGEIHALTGLHIGGSPAGLQIGGVDMPVIRNVFGVPYIPLVAQGQDALLWVRNGSEQN